MASMDVDFVLISEDESEDEFYVYETEEDDSDLDPTFDLVSETEKALTNLSMKKSRARIVDTQFQEEVDPKSFESVQKLIKDGNLEKLKVDQCKVYLKKHGLRLTGKKDVLLSRIQEHIELKDGTGEKKYPVSSFTLNCQGDACLGDVVIFEQTVYDMFSIASRSATGPPIGKRTVAGRIVHESYGEAKQQHTFTIEVLWSKGVKPLPPLYPLLIKGRNLYKLKTMRQKWNDEGERKKILQEKHERGNVARLSRDRRIQEKEMRNAQRDNRRRVKSHGKEATKPVPNFQDLTNLANREQPRENFPPEKHAYIPQIRTNLGFVQSNVNQAVEQPRPVQRDPQIKLNHNLVYPNGYSVGAIGGNNFVSRPPHQPCNGYDRQFSQQAPCHQWGSQRQINSGYNAHGFSHFEPNGSRNAPPVPRQLCKYHMKGQCWFGQACKFRHE
ncbi:Zinc finger CCCH domain-containing protein 62 [Rhynchospora pubera]|uniref:Zinc finger CCCH domain-containing protein 62 n=1 Tax=Rhynchospora pubera TaxID=906938 RepID=A0AAV8DND5_9POAL|nr:Zinc finger CCCH domain-containing protein 62 [Rhynchospora pubera]